ncbi:MAG: ATP-binding protein [Bacteroidales bacterium]|nr:ATP-binding protein [Bacteroidales bacterium]
MGQKLPIGIQSFEDLRNKDFKYVDKTAIVFKLVSEGKYYFLSRPRRFGKSLLLNTLESYFLGKRELFKGLAIEKLEHDWTEYSVLHLDLNTQKYDTPQALESILNEHLCRWEKRFDSDVSENSLGLRFMGVIRRAYEKTGRQVVILVDEYDKPLLQAIGNVELQDAYRATLKGFYGALKSMDGCIRFAFLTGVTKFGKVSVFSDLNNLEDISMRSQYFDICGITEEELHSNFEVEVSELASAQNMTIDETYAALRENYDGYHFCKEEKPGVYNPFSLLNALKNSEIDQYWFETGTPTYLMELLKRHQYVLPDLEHEEPDADTLNCVDIASTNPIPVIYQSGYLTIKGYDKEFELFRLGFPNREVKQGFLKYLMPFYANTVQGKSAFEVSRFVRSLYNGEIESFMERLQSFLSACPYELEPEQERHFQSVMFILTSLCGYYVEIETHTNKGRMDMTVKTKEYIYIFEFKFNKSAEEALAQINEKGYAEPFAKDERNIIKIGVNFSTECRNIDKWVIESKV